MAIALLVKELMILLREAKCNFIEQNCYILLVFKKKKNDLGGDIAPLVQLCLHSRMVGGPLAKSYQTLCNNTYLEKHNFHIKTRLSN